MLSIFFLSESIDLPTHLTENSSSLIDIILVRNKDNLLCSGVDDPFLSKDLRYHCPIYGIFRFSIPKIKSFSRYVWYYDRGNFKLLREKATVIDWQSLQDNDVNVFANNINTAIFSLAAKCIPNRYIKIQPLDN